MQNQSEYYLSGCIKTEIQDNLEQKNIKDEKEPVEFPEEKIPLTRGERGEAEQVAQLALFLASDASSPLTGTEIYIDWAESLLMG